MAEPPGFPAFVVAWNRLQGQGTPDLHLEIATWLEARWRAGDRELLLMAFRGAGKSTLVGLFAAWLLAGDPDRRILVLAADLALACKTVRTVRRLVTLHPVAAPLRPARPEQWAADQFTVRRRATLRDPSLLARGIAGNVTGSRADVVICDDVEVPRTAATAARREDLRARLAEIDYVRTPGGTTLYVGTPHARDSIYAREGAGADGAGGAAPFLDGFARLELPALDGQGRSRWPERFPPARLEAIRRRHGPARFRSQMMLEPADVEGGRLDPERMKPYDAEPVLTEANGEARLTLCGRRLVAASAWWDPAFAAPGRGDASVVAALYADDAGGYWLHRVLYLEHDPARAAALDPARQLCRQVAALAAALHLPAVAVETNGIGRFLPDLLRHEFAAAGLGTAVLEETSRLAKRARILGALDAPLAAGALNAHRSVWATPLVAEMREWRPGGGGRDDGLDAVAGCLLMTPVRLPRVPRPPRTDWRGLGPVAAPVRFRV